MHVSFKGSWIKYMIAIGNVDQKRRRIFNQRPCHTAVGFLFAYSLHDFCNAAFGY